MVAALPIRKASLIVEEVKKFAAKIAFLSDVHGPEYDVLLQSAKSLAKNDVIDSCRLQAYLYLIDRNEAEFNAAVLNLERNNYRATANYFRMKWACAYLLPQDALDYAKRLVSFRGDISLVKILKPLYLLGYFREVREMIQESIARQEVIPGLEMLAPAVEQAIQIEDNCKLPDGLLVKSIQCISDILSAHNLSNYGGKSIMTLIPMEEDGPTISVAYTLPISASMASDINWEIAEVLVDNDLQNPNVSFMILGAG